MAEVARFVNTGSTPGGDGTTKATAGDNRAYASLNEWESNEETDLVTASDTHVVECDGGEDDTALNIAGWTLGASDYVTVRAASGNEAQMPWSTSIYRLSIASNVRYCSTVCILSSS